MSQNVTFLIEQPHKLQKHARSSSHSHFEGKSSVTSCKGLDWASSSTCGLVWIGVLPARKSQLPWMSLCIFWLSCQRQSVTIAITLLLLAATTHFLPAAALPQYYGKAGCRLSQVPEGNPQWPSISHAWLQIYQRWESQLQVADKDPPPRRQNAAASYAATNCCWAIPTDRSISGGSNRWGWQLIPPLEQTLLFLVGLLLRLWLQLHISMLIVLLRPRRFARHPPKPNKNASTRRQETKSTPRLARWRVDFLSKSLINRGEPSKSVHDVIIADVRKEYGTAPSESSLRKDIRKNRVGQSADEAWCQKQAWSTWLQSD